MFHKALIFSNVIVDITFPGCLLVFSQSCYEVSASLGLVELNICLTSTYFQCNIKHYKNTAMRSLVSVVVTQIVM